LGVRHSLVYLVLGAIVWLLFLKSGIHATLAAVVMAFTIPATRRIDTRALGARIRGALEALRDDEERGTEGILTPEDTHALHEVEVAIEHATPPLQRLEHGLIGFVTFVVMPVFALANAGVGLGGDGGADLGSAPALGIMGGLVIGKPLGIFLAAFLAVKMGVAALPAGVTWRQVFAVSVLGGIGFTMALFVGGLAFESTPGFLATAKLAILVASAVAGIVGLVLLKRFTSPPSDG
ncbi:MAG: Na+/H+ antiporter NhaA, partial [Myxococcales bacterium]|nr:Na+/H+ antiporter NhaA [Myxococcales bacterium]